MTVDEQDELPDEIFDQIADLSEDGEDLFENEEFEQAIEKWTAAVELLPEPKGKWEAALWLYTAIGDGYRNLGDLDKALVTFNAAYEGVEGSTNPYVLYSIGATLYDLDRHDEAVVPLLKAYEMEGEEIFEEDGEVYLAFLEEKGFLDDTE